MPIGSTTPAHVPGIVVHRPSPHAAKRSPLVEFGKKTARPIQITAIWAGADKRQVHSVPGNPRSETPVLRCIFFRRKVAATAPRFVSHAPIADLRRFTITVDG